MIDWLINDWLIDDWLIDWLMIDWLIDWLMIDWLIDWLILHLLVAILNSILKSVVSIILCIHLVFKLIDWSIDWFIDWCVGGAAAEPGVLPDPGAGQHGQQWQEGRDKRDGGLQDAYTTQVDLAFPLPFPLPFPFPVVFLVPFLLPFLLSFPLTFQPYFILIFSPFCPFFSYSSINPNIQYVISFFSLKISNELLFPFLFAQKVFFVLFDIQVNI